MGKYAVIGDSYAVLDDEHSHWAKFWAEKNNHGVDFYGLEGSNLVNISYLLDNINLESYDGVIIHYTSPLRSEGSTYKDNKKLPVVSQMSDVYSCEPKDLFKYFLPDNPNIDNLNFDATVPKGLEFQYYANQSSYKYLVNFHNLMPHWFENFDAIDSNTSSYDSIMTTLCNEFYSSVSIRWLVRANFLAYRNIVLTLNAKSIKNVTVFPTCGGFEQTISHIKNKYPDTNLWDQTTIVSIHPTETNSRNHIPIDHAKSLADKFTFM